MRWGLPAVLLGVAAAVALAAPQATSAPGGVTVSVNGTAMGSESNIRLPGCNLDLGVSGLPPGAHTVAFAVTAMDPSGTGTVLSVSEPAVSGSFTTGPRNMAATLSDGGWVKASNGYHLRIAASVDGVQVGAAPYWLACGAVQHAGHSVQVAFSVEWRDSSGRVLSGPPAGAADGLRIVGASQQGQASCRYEGDALQCSYVVTTEEGSSGEAPPTGLRVSGLGTYTVEEIGLTPPWVPVLSTVGQFAADPTLRQWTGPEDEEAAVSTPSGTVRPAATGPPTVPHTIVNVLP